MTSILFEQKPRPTGPEPLMAAIYSIIPGIGQLYNGKTRKGVIFLLATFISILMLYTSVNPIVALEFSKGILALLNFIFFFWHFNIEPSPAAPSLMEAIKFGGTFSGSLLVIIFCFVIYSMIDAFRDAEDNYRAYDYKLTTTGAGISPFLFSESTTSSYIIHSIALSLLFIFSLFMVFPTKNKEQVTEIEFIMPQIESKKPPPPDTKRKSTNQSIDQGKHDPEKPITPPQMSRPAQPKAPQQVAMPQMVEQPAAMPQPVVKPQPVANPQAPPPAPEAVTPPQPRKPVPKAAPKVSDRPALLPSKPAPAPIKNSASTSQGNGTGNNPQPVAPAPDAGRSSGSGNGTHAQLAVAPQVPGQGGRGGLGNDGNPPPNTNTGAASIAAKKDLDFGPYMEELQRKIKRAWRPPRGNESKRVIVIFKINSAGALSDLRIRTGSAFKPSDDAALEAVKAAAPFSALPKGAPSTVEIEFTFDYNVFGAR